MPVVPVLILGDRCGCVPRATCGDVRGTSCRAHGPSRAGRAPTPSGVRCEVDAVSIPEPPSAETFSFFGRTVHPSRPFPASCAAVLFRSVSPFGIAAAALRSWLAPLLRFHPKV
eukprot:scaffold387_cov244-Pinguiococcus_pyrenoidosus.AAC.16